ncbi:PREDICTED: venom serine protease [Bactrocera latifrons]|uniref:venom serine protease n=1 Tax=Bactrocera latifrons TaxID=174628 RepID=UPI0008DCD9FC|nr:PREDICTED: venom serine protease [Bactrocera latifrons]
MSHKRTLICSIVLLILLSGNHGVLALFEGCDSTFEINPGTTYLQSPYYPNTYPPWTSCRYQIIAPLDYTIEANCTIDFPSNAGQCTTEYFYVSTEGDPQLRDSEQFCGQGAFTRVSLFRKLTLAYASYGNTGRFLCSLTIRPQQCECGWSTSTKIANGQEVGTNEFPFMVGLQNLASSTDIFCGGTIISHFHIITAAHCATIQPDASQIIAHVGFTQISTLNNSRYAAAYRIQSITMHPGYTDDPPVNDISVLVTRVLIEWERGVGPICLPPAGSSTFAYQNVDVAGWGTESFAGPTTDALMKANLMVVENSVCQEKYNVPIYSSQICTTDYSGQGRDACQYDSGGPVVWRSSRMFLVGCISFGQACGQPYGTGVNTRITYFLNWIRQVTGYTTCVKQLG